MKIVRQKIIGPVRIVNAVTRKKDDGHVMAGCFSDNPFQPIQQLFFVDTCHAGNIMGVRRAASRDITAVINELASAENGTVVFASSSGNQYSLEDDVWGNGAFTKAVVEGLDGKADYTGKGKITINMLDLYISERVKELTRGKQTPTTTKPYVIPDFPIALSQH